MISAAINILVTSKKEKKRMMEYDKRIFYRLHTIALEDQGYSNLKK
jgi:hypothetical protein